MKKVFLVDDEIVIRENMKACMNWEDEGFVYCGDAPDGEVALPLIEELQPDILITDIKMPFMNGLELSAVIRRILPQTKIIIISGHDDFDYARQAIRLGVEDYCLKPFGAADILRMLRLISMKIDKERAASDNGETTRDERPHPLSSANEHSLLSLVGSSFDQPVFLDRRKFIEYVTIGNATHCDDFIRSFAAELKPVDWHTSVYGFYLLNDLTIEVIREAQTLFRNIEAEDTLSSLLGMVIEIRSWDQALDYLRKLADQFWQWRSHAADKYGELIAQIKAYVQANYAKDTLTLQDAAEHVCVSPSHMSKIFSQETGQTFIEYLMHTRIDKAKVLLQATNAKSYEVAYQVGYQDPHYFSSLFKRVTGITIREFRKHNKVGET